MFENFYYILIGLYKMGLYFYHHWKMYNLLSIVSILLCQTIYSYLFYRTFTTNLSFHGDFTKQIMCEILSLVALELDEKIDSNVTAPILY